MHTLSALAIKVIFFSSNLFGSSLWHSRPNSSCSSIRFFIPPFRNPFFPFSSVSNFIYHKYFPLPISFLLQPTGPRLLMNVRYQPRIVVPNKMLSSSRSSTRTRTPLEFYCHILHVQRRCNRHSLVPVHNPPSR